MEEYNAFIGVIDPNSGDVFLYKPIALAVPEPSTAAMLLVGLLGIFASSRSACVEGAFEKAPGTAGRRSS